jgi:hypothetical protein
MKKILLILLVFICLILGTSKLKAGTSLIQMSIISKDVNYVYIIVYESGHKLVYVYTEDGHFIKVYVDDEL